MKINKILIVYSRFNQSIVESLLEGAMNCFKYNRVKEELIEKVGVPGVYEIPLAVKSFLEAESYDGVVVLGCIIQGETYHHDLITQNINFNLGQISFKKNVPISLGILAVKNRQQAIERAGGKKGNQGWQAASSNLEMIELLQVKLKN